MAANVRWLDERETHHGCHLHTRCDTVVCGEAYRTHFPLQTVVLVLPVSPVETPFKNHAIVN